MGSFGGNDSSNSGMLPKENKSNQLYEKIKNANNNKKKLATIFAFTK